MRHLTKDEFWVKFHGVFFQQGEKFRKQGEKFRIKAHLLMMGFLALYVSNNGGNNGAAHAESRVALSPCEVVTFLVRPS